MPELLVAASESPQVLIVGAGPVGLSLAIELGLRRIRCLVVEQRPGTADAPKALLINTRTMEHCRRWGIADRVLHEGFPAGWPYDVTFVTAIAGRELFRFEQPGYGDVRRFANSPERNGTCAQIYFDRILFERARSIPEVTVQLQTRLESFVQDGGGVKAEVFDVEAGKSRTILAAYLVACDGAQSGIRRLAGIGTEQSETLNTNLNIFFRARGLVERTGKGPAQLYRMIDSHGSWGNCHMVDARELWRLTVHLNTTALDHDPIHYVRKAMGIDIPIEILSAARWDRRELVADSFRCGRVFIAGDAAHQLSTTGGFGMNTGIGDAVDLGWKLAAALNGWAGEPLLQSYEKERKPIAVRNIKAATGNFRRQATLPGGVALDSDSSEGVEQRSRFVDAVNTLSVRAQFVSEGIALGYRYDNSPLILLDGTPPPPDEIMTYTQTARPGSRAPHAWIDQGQSTLDQFGNGFTLLYFDNRAHGHTMFIDAAQHRGVPLRAVEIVDKQIAQLYERALVLVRPDGHVAWRADDVTSAQAEQVLARASGFDAGAIATTGSVT